MINANEIYYLNKALDGEEIYGINSMEGVAISLNSKNSAKESLVEKNILTKTGNLNDVSYALIEALEKYKNAKEYLWINGRIASIDDTNFVIHLERDEKENIIFKEVTKPIMLYSVISENSFLWGNKSIEDNVEYIPRKRFVPRIINENKEDKDKLYIQKEIKGRVSLFNVYYKEEKDVFKYDFLSQLLKKVNPKDIRKELIEVFNMDWGENIG